MCFHFHFDPSGQVATKLPPSCHQVATCHQLHKNELKIWKNFTYTREVFETLGVDIDVDIFEIQTVHFAEILREKYSKLEYWSNGNPSVPICRWKKRYFGETLFENTIFSTLKFSFKIKKVHLKSERFKIKKQGRQNDIVSQVERMGSLRSLDS